MMMLDWMKPLLPLFIIKLILSWPTFFQYLLGAILSIYWALPIAFHFIPAFRRLFVFAHRVEPYGGDKAYKGETGFGGACKYLRLVVDPKRKWIELGTWHILPVDFLHDDPSTKNPRVLYKEKWEIYMKESEHPIFIYLHGNSGSRVQPNRIELCNILQMMNFHVIAFDYRGYGDSTYATPTEEGLVNDAKVVYNYVHSIIGEDVKKRLFLWGHSLGTAVTCRVMAELCEEQKYCAGVVLEAPFTNIRDAVRNYNLVKMFYQDVPAFDYIFVQPLHNSGIRFESDKHITKISVPILILHAVDDSILPFPLGRKLYEAALKNRPNSFGPVYFKKFDKGFGHVFICKSPELPDIIRAFVTSCIPEPDPRERDPEVISCVKPSKSHTNASGPNQDSDARARLRQIDSGESTPTCYSD